MAISQSTVTHSDGSTDVNVHVPFIAPPKPSDACSTAKPIVGQLVATVSTTGGSIAGGQNLYYYLSAIDASSNESIPSDPIEVVIPAGTNTNQVTISGINPFDANASLFNVYRALGAPNGQGGTTSGTSPAQLFANQTPPSACAGLSITDTGSNGSNGGAGDPTKMPIAEDVVRIRAYWQLNGESQWRFGGETLNGQGTAVDFIVPHNIQGQAINIQLRSVDSRLNETPSSLAPIEAYTITAAYPAGLGVGGAPGAGDGLKIGGLHVFNTGGIMDKSSPVVPQGSLLGFFDNSAFSYSSASTSLSFWNTAFTVYMQDGSSFSVPASGSSGSPAFVFTGLTASTTYFFGAYYDIVGNAVHMVLSDVNSGKSSGSQQFVSQTINGDGRIPLFASWQVATPASGTGGGGGGTGGGGGGRDGFL